jgi:hypothetical protein
MAMLVGAMPAPTLAVADMTIEVPTAPRVGQPITLLVRDAGGPVEGAAVTAVAPARQAGTVTASALNVRGGPSTAYGVVTQLSSGARVLVKGTAGAGWYNILTPTGIEGFVSPSFLRVAPWGQPFGATGADGKLLASDLTLAPTLLTLVAEKDGATSEPVTIEVRPRALGGVRPEHVVLSWADDPDTTQSVTWRTHPDVTGSVVQYAPARGFDGFDSTGVERIEGEDRLFGNDLGEMRIHDTTITGLTPATEYVYRVGDGGAEGWSEPARFRTDAAGVEPFTFLFTSDTQAVAGATSPAWGYNIWDDILNRALTAHPDARWMLLSGDVVDRGEQQAHWEDWFAAASPEVANLPMAPVVGNHDAVATGERNFAAQFNLPKNGPEGEEELTYSFDYGNVHVTVLNTESGLEEQTEWLRRDMGNSTKFWKVVAFHRPVYHSHPGRDNRNIRDEWVPVFDELGVDLVLNGHDHAYMRTYPMYQGEPQPDNTRGTTYVIGGSAGPKFYEMGDYPWIRVAFDEDIQLYSAARVAGRSIRFEATARDGRQVDLFTIQKDGLDDLRMMMDRLIARGEIDRRMVTPLRDKLGTASAASGAGDREEAAGALRALRNQVNAQDGKKVGAEGARLLRAYVTEILESWEVESS